MSQLKTCPQCGEAYYDVVLLYYLESGPVADAPVYGCPNCEHVCGIACVHTRDERLPAEPVRG